MTPGLAPQARADSTGLALWPVSEGTLAWRVLASRHERFAPAGQGLQQAEKILQFVRIRFGVRCRFVAQLFNTAGQLGATARAAQVTGPRLETPWVVPVMGVLSLQTVLPQVLDWMSKP